MDEIEKHFADFPPAKIVSSKTGLSVTSVVCIYLLISFLLSLSQFLGYYIVMITAMIYPGYRSIQVICNKNTSEDREWIMFWVLFGVHNFLDYFLGKLLMRIPIYYSARLLIVIYLVWPTTKGSMFVYNTLEKKLNLQEEIRSPVLRSRSFKED